MSPPNSPDPTATPSKTPAPAPAAAKPAAQDADLATLLAEPAARAWYRRPLLWVGLALLLAAAGGLWWWFSSRAANAAPSYTTQAVARGNLTLRVTANGTLQPMRSINIGSELSGTVLKVNVDVNDRIKKGQVLVVLDTAKLRDQILRSQAAVASAKGKVAQASATQPKRGPHWPGWKKWRACRAARCRPRPNWTAAAPRWPAPLADLSSAQAGVADAQAALSTDQINLSKASIVAPADGVVLTRTWTRATPWPRRCRR
jgi:HlyD family secretion protein